MTKNKKIIHFLSLNFVTILYAPINEFKFVAQIIYSLVRQDILRKNFLGFLTEQLKSRIFKIFYQNYIVILSSDKKAQALEEIHKIINFVLYNLDTILYDSCPRHQFFKIEKIGGYLVETIERKVAVETFAAEVAQETFDLYNQIPDGFNNVDFFKFGLQEMLLKKILQTFPQYL